MSEHDGEKPFVEEHNHAPILEGGRPVRPMLTAASEQQPDVEPDTQIRALLVTFACTIWWFNQLFMITQFAAFARYITPVLGDSGKESWIFNSFNVVTIVLAPIFASQADLYGRKWFIYGSSVFGIIGGAIGCRAKSTDIVILSTAFIGVAGSCLGLVTAIPSEVLTHRQRAAGLSFVFTASATAPFAALLGISSAITRDAVNGWRWMFYVAIILYAVQTLLFIGIYHPPPRENKLTQERPSLDYVGYFLLAGATIPFLMALTWGGSSYPWKSGHVLGTLLAGIAGYIIFGIYEWKGRKDGIMHHDLFINRNFALSCVAIAIEGLVYLSFTSTYPAQIATVYEHDTFKSSQYALPFYGAFIIGLPIGGYYVQRTKDAVSPIIVGYIFFLGAIIGFACSKPNTLGLFVGMDALAGLGFAQPLAFLTVVAQFAAPPELIATSTAITLSLRALGGSIGIAVMNTILNSKTSVKIPGYIAEAVLPMGLNPAMLGPTIGAATGDTDLIAAILQGKIPGVTPQILGAASAAAARAFSDSFKYCWITVIPFTVVGTLCLLLMKRNRHQHDYIIDAPLEHVHHKHAYHNETSDKHVV